MTSEKMEGVKRTMDGKKDLLLFSFPLFLSDGLRGGWRQPSHVNKLVYPTLVLG